MYYRKFFEIYIQIQLLIFKLSNPNPNLTLIGLYPRKTIYLDIVTMHTQLHAKYVTYCLLF